MDLGRPGPDSEWQQQQQQQRVGVAVAGEEAAGARCGELGDRKWSKSSNRAKFGRRSQSSPSSLTTHKFGLRPTPSPPRLIIDHQTGDIVESYPQQPIYLRTYQPLEDEHEEEEESQQDEEEDEHEDDLDSVGQVSEDSEVAKRRRQLDEYQRLLRHHQDPNHHEGFLASQEELQRAPEEMSGQPHNRHYRPAIPPPHTGKVYFAPPSVSGSAHQFGPASRQESLEAAPDQQRVVGLANSQSGSHNQSFKRALNKLNEAARTDIAILEPRSDLVSSAAAATALARQPQQPPQQIKVTATSAGRAQALLAQKRREPAPAKLVVPAIEHFRLYDLCYQLRALLVLLLSGLIVYLLVVPLQADCARHRPTLTYVSLILASVNLTCILIFSLFWYCSGVTRTLYANLSSSAFIITIYSILVALNLALGVLFFFANTCHFQKLMETPLELAHYSTGGGTLLSGGPPPPPPPPPLQLDQEPRIIRRHHHSTSRQREAARLARSWDEALEYQEEPATAGPLAPNMSPLEAAWEWACEQVQTLRRHFRHFLLRYDLRFVGALHALSAVCLQYMAMKVAVVRSHFCSPLAHYL